MHQILNLSVADLTSCQWRHLEVDRNWWKMDHLPNILEWTLLVCVRKQWTKYCVSNTTVSWERTLCHSSKILFIVRWCRNSNKAHQYIYQIDKKSFAWWNLADWEISIFNSWIGAKWNTNPVAHTTYIITTTPNYSWQQIITTVQLVPSQAAKDCSALPVEELHTTWPNTTNRNTGSMAS